MNIFKGFKQVSASQFNAAKEANELAGYLWFVRTEVADADVNSVENDMYDIYFGSKRYGHFQAGEIEGIKQSLEALNGNVREIVAALEVLTDIVEANTAALATKVDKVEGSRLMTETEGEKLAKVNADAQVNVIEEIKVNGEAVPVVEKTVSIVIPDAPVQGVAEDEKVLSLNGDKLATTLKLEYVAASEGKTAELRLLGKDNAVVYAMDATALVKDGMLAGAKLDNPQEGEEGSKYLVLSFNTEAGREDIRMDVSDLLDYYTSGYGLVLEGNQFSISEEFVNEVKALDNAVLSAATAYTEGNYVKSVDFQTVAAKVDTIAEGAEVNVVTGLTVNGVAAEVDEKKVANVKVDTTKVELGTVITAKGEEKFGPSSKLSDVLQGIQDSITIASGGAYLGVLSGNGISVGDIVGNQQTISAKISKNSGNLLSFDEDGGLFAAMYYDGDDAE